MENFLKKHNQGEQIKGTFWDLWRLPATRRNSILLCYSWFTFSMCYYGLAYNTPSLDWDPSLVFMLPPMLILPLCFIMPFLENTLGRKFILTFSLTLAGVMLVICGIFPTGHPGIIVSAWIGNIAVGMSFGVGYNYAKELYPTVLRATALGTASSSARVGSMVSPLIAMLDVFSDILSLIVYGVFVLSAGLFSIWIWPDTKNIRLPDTMEECEEHAASPNLWVQKLCCRSGSGSSRRRANGAQQSTYV